MVARVERDAQLSQDRDSPNSEERDCVHKKQGLDNALLFLSSTIPFGFSIVTLALGLPFAGVVALGPLLLLAVVFPLYVGYLRGAIELDSLCERSRGWTYLIYGSGFYAFLVVTNQLGSLSPSFIGSPLSLGLWVVGFGGLPWLTRQFIIWIYRVVEQGPIPIRDAVGIASTAVSVGMASIAFYAIGIAGGLFGHTVVPPSVEDAIGFVMAGSISLLPLLLVESNCQRYLDEAMKKIPPSSYAPSRPAFMDRFGRAMDRYSRYTVAILFAGTAHRS